MDLKSLSMDSRARNNHPNLPYKWFTAFLERHSLQKITYHQLRHTNASLLIATGTDVVTLSGRLGHGDKNITLNTYSHIIKSKEEKAANSMDTYYSQLTIIKQKSG
jgi:integrase